MKKLFQIGWIALLLFVETQVWADNGEKSRPAETPVSPPPQKNHPSKPVYQLHPAYDSAAIIIGGVVATSWLLGDEFGSAYCSPLCDKKDVNPIDRFAAGNYNQTWARVSDVTLITTLVSGLLVAGFDSGFPAFLTDGLVVVESVILANASIILLNVATRRPRPYLYSEDASLEKREHGFAALSFPSGHVGATAAMATAIFGLVHLRHPQSPWKWVWLSVGTLATGLVATGRVLSGRHFLTDVIAGAAIGAGIGVLIPALHKKAVSIMPTVSAAGFSLGLYRRF